MIGSIEFKSSRFVHLWIKQNDGSKSLIATLQEKKNKSSSFRSTFHYRCSCTFTFAYIILPRCSNRVIKKIYSNVDIAKSQSKSSDQSNDVRNDVVLSTHHGIRNERKMRKKSRARCIFTRSRGHDTTSRPQPCKPTIYLIAPSLFSLENKTDKNSPVNGTARSSRNLQFSIYYFHP